MTHPTCDLPDNVPDEVPDPQVAREFNVTLMTLWRWDRDHRLAELGWEPPIKIRTRNYRRRRTLEKFKLALRNFGITALRGVPRSNSTRLAGDARVAAGADSLSSAKRGRR
jgi:hypothetical protein